MRRESSGCVAALARWLRRATVAEGALAIEGRLELGGRKSLVLVRCCGKKFLIASGADAVTQLLEIEQDATPMETKLPARQGKRRVPLNSAEMAVGQ